MYEEENSVEEVQYRKCACVERGINTIALGDLSFLSQIYYSETLQCAKRGRFDYALATVRALDICIYTRSQAISMHVYVRTN